jgi:hypothetical protein
VVKFLGYQAFNHFYKFAVRLVNSFFPKVFICLGGPKGELGGFVNPSSHCSRLIEIPWLSKSAGKMI